MTHHLRRMKKQVAFSTAYFQAGQQVLAPKDSTITGYDKTLRGKRICTATGSTAYDALKEKRRCGFRRHAHRAAHGAQPAGLPGPAPTRLGDAVVTDNALGCGSGCSGPGGAR